MLLPRSLVALALSLSVAAVIASPAMETKADQILKGRQSRLGGRGHEGGSSTSGSSSTSSSNNQSGSRNPSGSNNPNGSSNPTGPSNPGPSQRSGSNHSLRRALDTMSTSEIAAEICPDNLYGCPIANPGSLSSLPSSLPDWISGGFECVDVTADLAACGGCASLDAKHDCTLITGAESVSCVSGVCVVDSCLASYEVDSNKSACILK